MPEELEFRWWLESPEPFEIAPYRRKFCVSCEGSMLIWGSSRKECENWVRKAEGARADHAAAKAGDAAREAERKAARTARRDAAAANAASQLSFGF